MPRFRIYDFINEKHWLPLEGKNDWETILSALEEIGYAGRLLRLRRVELDLLLRQCARDLRIDVSLSADLDAHLRAGAVAVHLHLAVVVVIRSEGTGAGRHGGVQRIPPAALLVEGLVFMG